MAAGYSGTPLPKKLGIKPDSLVATLHEPGDFRALLGELPEGARFGNDVEGEPDVVIAFYTDASVLSGELDRLADSVFPDRTLWLAWPKKTSGVATDLTGDVVRATVLATKLVDVKVCAISDIWSGLKVVWRKEHR